WERRVPRLPDPVACYPGPPCRGVHARLAMPTVCAAAPASRPRPFQSQPSIGGAMFSRIRRASRALRTWNRSSSRQVRLARPRSPFAVYRSPAGEQAVLQENRFVERLIGGLEYYLTGADVAEYRRPYLVPGESRRPTLTWPRELPLGGEPKRMYEIVRGYSDWLASDVPLPKLFVHAAPGALLGRPEDLAFVRTFKNQKEVTV